MKYQPDQAWKKEERKENIYSQKREKKKQVHRYTIRAYSTHSKWHCTQSEIRLAVIRSRMNHRPTLQPFHALLIATVKKKKKKKKMKGKIERSATNDSHEPPLFFVATLFQCRPSEMIGVKV